jgi:phage gp36-like protein
MAWTALTAAQVLNDLNNAEVEKYREIIADGQSDPLPDILARTTDYVRGFVGKQVPLDAAGLPPEVLNPAVDIAIYRLCKRVQTSSAEQRKPAADDAEEFLKGVAKGDTAVSPSTGDIVTPQKPSVEEPNNTFQPGDQDGA